MKKKTGQEEAEAEDGEGAEAEAGEELLTPLLGRMEAEEPGSLPLAGDLPSP